MPKYQTVTTLKILKIQLYGPKVKQLQKVYNECKTFHIFDI